MSILFLVHARIIFSGPGTDTRPRHSRLLRGCSFSLLALVSNSRGFSPSPCTWGGRGQFSRFPVRCLLAAGSPVRWAGLCHGRSLPGPGGSSSLNVRLWETGLQRRSRVRTVGAAASPLGFSGVCGRLC